MSYLYKENVMTLATQTQNNIRLRDLIGDAQVKIDIADAIVDPIVSWISPVGDMFIERQSTIQEMVITGSWR
jgi:hypothetical protein